MAIADLNRVSGEEELKEKLCNKLWQFRLALEAKTQKSVAENNVPVASVLCDFGQFVGLSAEQHLKVLGEDGVAFIDEILATRWWLTTKSCVNTTHG